MSLLTNMVRAYRGFNRDRLMDVFTDVTFCIGNSGETLCAHSAILSPLSPWIAQFMKQITCSCTSGPCFHERPHLDIILVGYESVTVEKMLETIYTGQSKVNMATANAIEQLGSSLGLRLAASLLPQEVPKAMEASNLTLASRLKQRPEQEIKMDMDPLATPRIERAESFKGSDFKCFKCGVFQKTALKLKFHLCNTHFKLDLIEKCQHLSGVCDICGCMFPDVNSIAMHLGMKHNKIRDFVSKENQPQVFADYESNMPLQSMILKDEQFALSMLRQTLNQTDPMVSCKTV